MKICIIGNSHIAALKLALRDGLFRNNALDIVFWGAPAPQYARFRVESGRLVSGDREYVLQVSDGQYESIDPADFAVLVFHGPAVNPSVLLRSLRKHTDDLRGYSAAFLREGIASHLDKRVTNALIRQIRTAYSGRILVSPLPMISEQSGFFGGMRFDAAERSLFDSALRGYFERLGSEFVEQPATTIIDSCYTAKAYCLDSVRLVRELDVKHPPDDYVHMNQLYGREVLQAIAQRLGL